LAWRKAELSGDLGGELSAINGVKGVILRHAALLDTDLFHEGGVDCFDGGVKAFANAGTSRD
jgi:hypothetical protein